MRVLGFPFQGRNDAGARLACPRSEVGRLEPFRDKPRRPHFLKPQLREPVQVASEVDQVAHRPETWTRMKTSFIRPKLIGLTLPESTRLVKGRQRLGTSRSTSIR